MGEINQKRLSLIITSRQYSFIWSATCYSQIIFRHLDSNHSGWRNFPFTVRSCFYFNVKRPLKNHGKQVGFLVRCLCVSTVLQLGEWLEYIICVWSLCVLSLSIFSSIGMIEKEWHRLSNLRAKILDISTLWMEPLRWRNRWYNSQTLIFVKKINGVLGKSRHSLFTFTYFILQSHIKYATFIITLFDLPDWLRGEYLHVNISSLHLIMNLFQPNLLDSQKLHPSISAISLYSVTDNLHAALDTFPCTVFLTFNPHLVPSASVANSYQKPLEISVI